MKRFILMFAALLAVNADARDLYRWTDDSGRVYYGDSPPAGAKFEIKKLSDDVVPGEYLPYETRRAQQNFPVTLYVTADCGEACDQARSLLTKRGVPFQEKLLKTRQDIEEFRQLSGIGDIVPVLAIGEKFLRGLLAEQWQSELDIAGYPKSSPYRVVPKVPAASPVAPTAEP